MSYSDDYVTLEKEEVEYLFRAARFKGVLSARKSVAVYYGRMNEKYGGPSSTWKNSKTSDLKDLALDLQILNHIKRQKGKAKEDWEPFDASSYFIKEPSVSTSDTLIEDIYVGIDPPFKRNLQIQSNQWEPKNTSKNLNVK